MHLKQLQGESGSTVLGRLSAGAGLSSAPQVELGGAGGEAIVQSVGQSMDSRRHVLSSSTGGGGSGRSNLVHRSLERTITDVAAAAYHAAELKQALLPDGGACALVPDEAGQQSMGLARAGDDGDFMGVQAEDSSSAHLQCGGTDMRASADGPCIIAQTDPEVVVPGTTPGTTPGTAPGTTAPTGMSCAAAGQVLEACIVAAGGGCSLPCGQVLTEAEQRLAATQTMEEHVQGTHSSSNQLISTYSVGSQQEQCTHPTLSHGLSTVGSDSNTMHKCDESEHSGGSSTCERGSTSCTSADTPLHLPHDSPLISPPTTPLWPQQPQPQQSQSQAQGLWQPAEPVRQPWLRPYKPEPLAPGSTTIAEAHPAVSVLFADIVGFSTLAATTCPQHVFAMLNELYALFDDLSLRSPSLYKVRERGA